MMPSSRGSQRVVVTIAALVAVAGVIQFWRMRAVNADLTEQLVRMEKLLQTAEENSSKIDSQRKEVGEDLKKANANFLELQIMKDEESMKCKHLQENLEELEDKRASLQKELDDTKETHNAELSDMARKVKSLRTQLEDGQQRDAAELATVRQELTAARQAAADAASCRSQLTQAQAELVKCQSAPAGQPAVAAGQPAVAAGQPAVAAVAVDTAAAAAPEVPGGRGDWPGLIAPRPQLGQALFERSDAAAAQQQRVLPAPAAVPVSSSTSSVRPAVGDALETLDKPRAAEEAVEGAGVLAPPQEPGAEEPAEGAAEQPAEGAGEQPEQQLDDDQYPVEGGKDALDDHPDPDPEGKDAALIKGLQELSNKSGRHEELPGPEPQLMPGEGGLSAPEMVGAVAAPEPNDGGPAPLQLR